VTSVAETAEHDDRSEPFPGRRAVDELVQLFGALGHAHQVPVGTERGDRLATHVGMLVVEGALDGLHAGVGQLGPDVDGGCAHVRIVGGEKRLDSFGDTRIGVGRPAREELEQLREHVGRGRVEPLDDEVDGEIRISGVQILGCEANDLDIVAGELLAQEVLGLASLKEDLPLGIWIERARADSLDDSPGIGDACDLSDAEIGDGHHEAADRDGEGSTLARQVLHER